MHRKALLEKLDAYEPGDAHEAQMADALRQFVAVHVDCFERSLEIGHVTGSAWVVDRERASVLLTHHRKLDKWLQPGGHADGDPDILRVALREVREECGLEAIHAVSEGIVDIDIHAIPARRGEREHLHYDVRFLIEADRDAPLALSEESRSLAWVRLEGIARLNPEESLARMVAKTRVLETARQVTR
jgi:8-oxo-dGTP pyrophosphatase MutT (NUDIX family)